MLDQWLAGFIVGAVTQAGFTLCFVVVFLCFTPQKEHPQ